MLYIYTNTEIPNLNKYSTLRACILEGQPWQRSQPQLFMDASVSDWHIWIWGFSLILTCRFAKARSSGIGRECLWTDILESLHRFLMRFKSGLWLSHLRSFTFLPWSQSNVNLAECSGSGSCWSTNCQLSHRSVALSTGFSSSIVLHLAPFLHYSWWFQVWFNKSNNLFHPNLKSLTCGKLQAAVMSPSFSESGFNFGIIF